MADELLPCPFCGGQAKLFHFSSAIRDEVWRVVCDKPFCSQGPDGYTEAEAIEAWNTRAERTCHAELNEDRNAITCSECGSTMLLKGWEEFHDWTGTTRISTFTTYPHCPNCGAKVVEE